MIIKRVLTVLLVGIMLAGAALAFPPFDRPANKRPHGNRMIERIAKDLGLTAQQKEKLLVEAKTLENEAEKVKTNNQVLFKQIDQELLKDVPNDKLIYNSIQQISQNNTTIQFKRMEQMIKLRKGLTPEQKKKLEKSLHQKREGHKS